MNSKVTWGKDEKMKATFIFLESWLTAILEKQGENFLFVTVKERKKKLGYGLSKKEEGILGFIEPIWA